MSPIQMIVLMATGLFIPPMLSVEPAGDLQHEPVIVKLNGDAGNVSGHLIVKIADDETDSQDSKLHALVVDASALAQHTNVGDIESGGPWLGIQFGPVSKPLASQLGLDADRGQMVLNVIDGSPAEQAGFQQYDVIVEIDGQAVSSDITKFLDRVREFAPAETHDFSLLRGGRSSQTSVIVGTRPESGKEFQYKYQIEVPGISQGQVFQRGGLLQKNKDGEWTFKGLDQLDKLHTVFEHLPKLGDDDMTFSWQGGWPGGGNRILMRIDKGKSVRIERNSDGEITVTKTTKQNGEKEKTSTTYADEEAFKQQDPDSYESYQKSLKSHPGSFSLHLDNLLKGPRGMFLFKHGDNDFNFDFDIDIDKLKDATRSLHLDADEFRKQMKQHLQLLDETRNKLIRKHKNHLQDNQIVQEDEVDVAFDGKVSTQFEINANGSVRVVIRQGEDELVENYDSPEQLKQTRPKLYEKYNRLKASPSEDDLQE